MVVQRFLMFRLPVVVSLQNKGNNAFAGTTPPPPSTCNKYFPSGLSPGEHNQINNTASFTENQSAY